MSNPQKPQVALVKKRRLLNLSEINGEHVEEDPLPTEAEGTTGSVDPVLPALDVQTANSEEKEQEEEAAEQRAVSFDEESEQTENEQQVERPKKSEWNGYDSWWWNRAEVEEHVVSGDKTKISNLVNNFI
jgi:hypothetical protein